MIVIERLVQEVYPGKYPELKAIDERYDAVEVGLGFPPKKRFWNISGQYDYNTLILERQWESLAAWEAAMEKALASPEIQALDKEGLAIVKSTRTELYVPAD
jgi:hypothetical protein